MHFEDSMSVKLLFDFWSVNGAAGMILTVIVLLLLAMAYELLKIWRIWLRKNSIPDVPVTEGRGTGLLNLSAESPLAPLRSTATPRWVKHFGQTVLNVLQVTMGYMLMLCVMSYNIWVFLAVIGGSVLGYFLIYPFLDH